MRWLFTLNTGQTARRIVRKAVKPVKANIKKLTTHFQNTSFKSTHTSKYKISGDAAYDACLCHQIINKHIIMNTSEKKSRKNFVFNNFKEDKSAKRKSLALDILFGLLLIAMCVLLMSFISARKRTGKIKFRCKHGHIYQCCF